MSKKPNKNSSGKSGKRLGLGLVLGLMLGLGIAAGVVFYVNDVTIKSPDLPVVEREPRVAPSSTVDPVVEDEAEDRFEFYEGLPEQGKVVEPRIEQKKRSVKNKEIFFLQVAALSNLADADNLKARLALLSFESKIQELVTSDGRTLYRVRVGPFDELSTLEEVKVQLEEFNFEVTVVRIESSE
jgi:cell division protein FtsN